MLDALRPWGDLQKISDNIQKHFDAGADHVCVQLVVDQTDYDSFKNGLPVDQWQRLAESLI